MTPDELAALHAKCFEMPRPWKAAEFSALLELKGVFLKHNNGGFILGREISGESELLTLAVDPDKQRQGWGRRLLADFEAESKIRGATQAFLEVAENNLAARPLYEAAGYSESGRRPAYYNSPDGTKYAAILLRKPLI